MSIVLHAQLDLPKQHVIAYLMYFRVDKNAMNAKFLLFLRLSELLFKRFPGSPKEQSS